MQDDLNLHILRMHEGTFFFTWHSPYNIDRASKIAAPLIMNRDCVTNLFPNPDTDPSMIYYKIECKTSK